MVTIKEVARLAGVSASTVSRTLSGKVPVKPGTRRRVLAAVAELGYQPNLLAQGLKYGSSRTIGILVPNIHDLVFPEAIRGISEVATASGYTVVLSITEGDLQRELSIITNLRRRQIDGLILFTATTESGHILQLVEAGLPVVLALRHMGKKVDAVIADNFQGGYHGAKFLLEKGFRQIALINGPLQLDLYRRRFEGFTAAFKEAGVSLDQTMIRHGVFGWPESRRTMCNLLEQGHCPEAVFAASDVNALGVVRALRDWGLGVPGDVSVLGFDNLDISAATEPPLTTINQPFYIIGRKAAERLFDLMKGTGVGGERRPRVEQLPVDLVIRNSVSLK